MGMFFKYFPNCTLLNLLYWPNDEQRIILVPSFGLITLAPTTSPAESPFSPFSPTEPGNP